MIEMLVKIKIKNFTDQNQISLLKIILRVFEVMEFRDSGSMEGQRGDGFITCEGEGIIFRSSYISLFIVT